MLVEYTYLHHKPVFFGANPPPMPKQGDAVQVMGDEHGLVYDGTITAVAEPVFPSPDLAHEAYLLYVEIQTGQDGIHDLVKHINDGGSIALRLA